MNIQSTQIYVVTCTHPYEYTDVLSDCFSTEEDAKAFISEHEFEGCANEHCVLQLSLNNKEI